VLSGDLILAACGRVDFAPLQPGSLCDRVGHDEDGDGVDDGCDVCPHLADPAQADGDGDGVGDACDPEPAVPRQSIALFEPFMATSGTWTPLDGNWTSGADEIQAVTMADLDVSVIALALDAASDQVVVVGSIDLVRATLPRQLAIHFYQAVTQYAVYCEVYDDGAPLLALTQVDTSGFIHLADEPFLAFPSPGPFVLLARIDASALVGDCESEFVDAGGTTQETSIGFAGDLIDIQAINLDLTIRSVTVIRTAP